MKRGWIALWVGLAGWGGIGCAPETATLDPAIEKQLVEEMETERQQTETTIQVTTLSNDSTSVSRVQMWETEGMKISVTESTGILPVDDLTYSVQASSNGLGVDVWLEKTNDGFSIRSYTLDSSYAQPASEFAFWMQFLFTWRDGQIVGLNPAYRFTKEGNTITASLMDFEEAEADFMEQNDRTVNDLNRVEIYKDEYVLTFDRQEDWLSLRCLSDRLMETNGSVSVVNTETTWMKTAPFLSKEEQEQIGQIVARLLEDQ